MKTGAVKSFYKDGLHVQIFENRQELGHAAAADAAEAIRAAITGKGYANVMFAAAPSQNEVLAALCADKSISWSSVHAFHMDEYIGLSESHPAGFRNYLKEHLFSALPFASVNLLNGNAEDPLAEAKRYSALLDEHPIDVCLCGIGENGHLAFNDPPADFRDHDSVKIVMLEESCRLQQVHDKCFEHLDEVPVSALTVTVPALVAASCIICSVPAAAKANAVQRTLEGNIDEYCPASILRTHQNACLYLDENSAVYLKTGVNNGRT